jgi:hypothetical protein
MNKDISQQRKEEEARKLAAKFNSLNIPTLSGLEMKKFLRRNNVKFKKIIASKEMRDKFFNIEKRGYNVFYSKKKDPVHYSEFLCLINEYLDKYDVKRLRTEKRIVTDKDMRDAVNLLDGILDDDLEWKKNLTVDRCIMFLKEKGYCGTIERKTTIEF